MTTYPPKTTVCPPRVRWLPLALLAAVAVIGALDLTGTLGNNRDFIGGAMILCWCIAPAAGLYFLFRT